MKPLSVVLVDDNPTFLRITGRFLAISHPDELVLVGTPGTAEEALELATRLHPGALVADLVLPGLSGLELIRQLRKQRADIVLVLVVTLALGRALGLSPKLAALIGVGTSICGNTAIAATAPVIKADERDLSFAVATITLFGTAGKGVEMEIFRDVTPEIIPHLQQDGFDLGFGKLGHGPSQVLPRDLLATTMRPDGAAKPATETRCCVER